VRRLLLALAIALLVVPSVPPVASSAGNSLIVHMVQHVLIGDLAPLLLLLGLDTVVTWLHPAAALVLWALTRAVWHYPSLFDAAVAHPALHVLEHACLFAGGLALWAVVLGRTRAALGVRIGLDAAFQLGSTALGLTFVFAATPLFPHYVAHHSFASPMTDQRAAGAVMMGENTIVAFSLLAWLLLGLFREEADPSLAD
jgi:cytochrome c oxidase assembly factor CtaG